MKNLIKFRAWDKNYNSMAEVLRRGGKMGVFLTIMMWLMFLIILEKIMELLRL